MHVLWRRGRWLQMMQRCGNPTPHPPAGRGLMWAGIRPPLSISFWFRWLLFSFSTHTHTVSYILICLWLTCAASAVFIQLPNPICTVWLMLMLLCIRTMWVAWIASELIELTFGELKAVGIGIVVWGLWSSETFSTTAQWLNCAQRYYPPIKSKAKEQWPRGAEEMGEHAQTL